VVVSDHTGLLGDLALLTVVQGAPVLGVDLPGRAVPDGAVVCPVVVRYRTEDSDHLPAEQVPTTVGGIAAVHGLVVELHLLPALTSAG
jgi:hypothetical protein